MKEEIALEPSMAERVHDEQGHEIPDPVPMEPPLGYRRTPSLAEQIRMHIRSEALRRAAEEAGYETFEEADDFDVGDDYDPTSPYEEVFDPAPDSADADAAFEEKLASAIARATEKLRGGVDKEGGVEQTSDVPAKEATT